MKKKELETQCKVEGDKSLEAVTSMQDVKEQPAKKPHTRKAGAQPGKPHKLTGKYSKMSPEARQLSTQNIGKALVMHRQGHNAVDISAVIGCHPETIRRTIKKFAPIFHELENVVDFREARADILDAGQLTTLKSLVEPERMNAARLGDVAKTFDVLYKAGRLERGQSTQNVETFTRISVDKHNS